MTNVLNFSNLDIVMEYVENGILITVINIDDNVIKIISIVSPNTYTHLITYIDFVREKTDFFIREKNGKFLLNYN